MKEVEFATNERLTRAEYVRFLRTSDLGSLYPRQGFEERIRRLLENVDVTVTARSAGRLVGVCLGITDNAYFLFLTDLGVSRTHEGRGIGQALVERAHDAVGGGNEMHVIAWSNKKAMAVYASCGMKPRTGLVAKEASESDLFDVRELPESDEND